MGQADGNITYNTFTKGIITEATDINFPPSASYDEANLILHRSGYRRRRKGIDYISNYLSPTAFSLPGSGNGTEFKYYWWRAVANSGSINFLVFQVGTVLYVYDQSSLNIIGTIDLTTQQISGAAGIGNDKVAMVSNRGNLFVVGKQLQPFYVSYSAGTLTTTAITLGIRDFDGVVDGLAIDNNPSTLSDAHQYNLRNQGWTVSPSGTDYITTYYSGSSSTKYPANTQVWFLGKDSTGAFTYATLNKTDFGTTPAPKGRYILDPFHADRAGVSGIGSIALVSYTSRPQCVEAYAGRTWYAGLQETAINGNVYYSQVIDNVFSNVGKCYQLADPTSENDSALVDTDGGVVQIAGAGRILKLFVANDTLMVFADNGIWSISGEVGASFKGTDYIVYQVSVTPLISPDSVVSVDNKVFYATDRGIFFAQRDSISGKFVEQSLTDTTIKQFYDNIPTTSKANIQAIYDVKRRQVQFLYSGTASDTSYKRNVILIFDLVLGAFTYHTISPLASNSPYLLGAMDFLNTTNWYTSSVGYLGLIPSGGNWKFNFCQFSNGGFLDWQTADTVGVGYSSYLESGFEYAQDIERNKYLPYIFSYFNKTETAWVYNASTGGYDFDFPSSCFLQVKWDLTKSSTSNRWSTPAQVYKYRQLTLPDSGNLTLGDGYNDIVSKTKIRGEGKTLRYRFYSDGQKDFYLLGWASNLTGNTQV